MTAILGISAYYHDSAAALVVDGEIIAAAQEERFTRIKHDFRFPSNAVKYCLREGGLDHVDYIVFYDKPLTKFGRLLETYLSFAPLGYQSFRQAMPLWLKSKLMMRKELDHEMAEIGLPQPKNRQYVFTDHHESHAASAYFPSPYDEAAIITLDGVGEWSTSCWGYGQGNKIKLGHEIRFPHSLGLLYSAFTYYTGFKVNSGEYKLMGLAPYGEPHYADIIKDHLIDLKEDGSYRLDMQYFNYCQGLTMTSDKFHKLFGGPPREPESQISQKEMDLAASVQKVTEEVMLKTARHVHEQTKSKNLVMAGGVALNCVGNGKILREGPFENIWIQPAAGDAGGALGAALFVWYQLLDKPRTTTVHDLQKGSLLGPGFSDDEIAELLDKEGAVYTTHASMDDVWNQTASLLAQEKVVGWFQGRMEFGPRALGGRSIIGDPRSEKMQSVMNLKIKFRESFRPFAPIVMREHVHEYFEMRPNEDSPYMLQVAPVLEKLRTPLPAGYESTFGIERLNHKRSTLPAITHVDYSARVQTVDDVRAPLLYGLLKAFYEKTGCPVLVNTSFNVRSEPIVCSPRDAYRCFLATDMDVLVLGRQILLKEEQTKGFSEKERSEHLSKFALD